MVYTTDTVVSESIAKSCLIPSIASSLDDLINNVDAVLLARDDAENHLKFALPVIQRGLPIFIDKPVALHREDLRQLLSAQLYPGQIFTCSSLAFAKEFRPSCFTLRNLGELQVITATVPKSWEKYAIHGIEPALRIVRGRGNIQHISKVSRGIVEVFWDSGLCTRFQARGKSDDKGFLINLTGTKGKIELSFTDPFNAFKNSLIAFVDHINGCSPFLDYKILEDVVHILEVGAE